MRCFTNWQPVQQRCLCRWMPGLRSSTRHFPLPHAACTRSSEFETLKCQCQGADAPCAVLSPPSASSLPAPFVQCIFPKRACVEVSDSSKNRDGCPAPRTPCPFQYWITYRLIDEGRLHTAFSASKEFALKSWFLHSKLHTFLAISSQAPQCLEDIAGKLVTLDHGAGSVGWVVQQEGDDGNDSSEIIKADTSFLFCQFSL